MKKKSENLFNFVLMVKLGVRGTIRRDMDEERESQTLKPFIAQKYVFSDPIVLSFSLFSTSSSLSHLPTCGPPPKFLLFTVVVGASRF